MNLDKEQKEEHLDYLFKSLQHHPSPYLIYDLEGNIKWANLAAEFIFRIEELTELSLDNKLLSFSCT